MWSYTNDPTNVPLDAVRFYVGDTNTADQQLTDEELTFLLTNEASNPIRAAARAAEQLAAKFARQVDKSVGGLSLSAGVRMDHYLKLATRLWSQASATGPGLAGPYAGGISYADKQATASNTDRVRPIFTKHGQEIPAGELPNSGLRPDFVAIDD